MPISCVADGSRDKQNKDKNDPKNDKERGKRLLPSSRYRCCFKTFLNGTFYVEIFHKISV